MKTMTSVLIQVASSTAIFAVIGNVIAHQGRRQAREYIVRLDEMQQSYESKTKEDYSEAKTDKQREYLDKRSQEDRHWHARERAIQEEWLARPFYRQLGFVPFPDFANTK